MSDVSVNSPPQTLVVHSPGLIAPGESNLNVLRVAAPSWIEIQLVGMDGSPVPGEKYCVILPDGAVHDGRLDDAGSARLAGFPAGKCRIYFPDLDATAWEEVDVATSPT